MRRVYFTGSPRRTTTADPSATKHELGVPLRTGAKEDPYSAPTSQASFLLDCGLGAMLAAADLRTRADATRLVHEHEMGELFKVLAFAKATTFAPIGFASGDRRHRL